MTYDFAPIDYYTDHTAPMSVAAPTCAVGVALALAHAPAPPAHPTMQQMAALVGELFTEGTLSWDQLKALGGLPELKELLDETIAGVSPARRLLPATR